MAEGGVEEGRDVEGKKEKVREGEGEEGSVVPYGTRTGEETEEERCCVETEVEIEGVLCAEIEGVLCGGRGVIII